MAVIDPSQMAAPAQQGSQTTVIPLGTKPYSTPYYSVGKEICQNMFLELSQSQFAKSDYYLLKIPGLKRFGEIPTANAGACRALITTTDKRTFIVNGRNVYEILIDASRVYIGSLNSYSGPVSIAEGRQSYLDDGGNNITTGLLCIVDGIAGYILRLIDNNLTRITDEYFPGVQEGTDAPTHVTYLDTYFIVNVPNTNQYYYSNSSYTRDFDDTSGPYDPAQPNGYWTPLQSGQKIGKTDNISALVNCNNFLWLFGYNSCEIHYDTGDYNGQLFARYQGAILNVGCNAPYSVATYQNNVFFLGNDNQGTLGVFSNDGVSPVRISTRGIEQLIESMGTWSDCQSYCYAQSGHAFYVMQFPSASKTLVYDMVTQSWHERTKLLQSTGAIIRWDGMYATSNFDKLIVGDIASSASYQLDPFYYMNDNPMDSGNNFIRCVKTTPIAFDYGKNVRYNWIQPICNQGSGTTNNVTQGAAIVGVDPTIQIAWSNDTGYTWSNERTAPLGKQGEYEKRSRILGCGMGRNRVHRIAMTDPVPFILVALLVNGSTCKF